MEKKLWNRNFVMVLAGQIISLFGNAVLRFALPLYLLNITGSAALFGMVSACAFVPMILLAPVGGILADRLNKRNIMVLLDFTTAILTGIFMLLLPGSNAVLLILVMLVLLYGIQGAYQPTVQASIPLLVPKEDLMRGNAMINLVSSVSGLTGPVIGGIVFGFFGIMPILAVSAVCFFLSAVMEILIHIPYRKMESTGNMFQMGFEDLKESFQFMVEKRPEILKACFCLAAINLILSACAMIGLPVVVNTKLGFSMETANRLYGYVQGAFGAGSLLGGILAGVFAKKVKAAWVPVILFACGLTLIPIAFSLMIPMPGMAAYGIIAVSAFVMMLLAAFVSIQMMSYLQILTPHALMGKVISCAMCISMCASPIGQAIYGLAFQYISQTYVIFLTAFAATALVSGASVSLFRGMKRVLEAA